MSDDSARRAAGHARVSNGGPRRAPFAPRALFDEAIALITSGELSAAELHCQRALEAHPRDVNMLALLGAILIKLERPSEAESRLLEAIKLAPTFAKPHEDLGRLLAQRGRAADARPHLERAVRLDPQLDAAWFTLGKVLAVLGDGAGADEAFERSFALSPERRLMALAAEHQKEGRPKEAEQLYRRVLRQNPDNVDALRLCALVAANDARELEAEGLLQKAISLAPDYLAALLDLGRLRKEQDRYAEALDCFDRVLAIDADNVQAHFLRGGTLAAAAFTEDAIEAYQHCLRLTPDHLGALLGLGHVLKAVGRYQAAVDSYQACITQRPDLGESYWSLANLKTYRFDSSAIGEMERQLRDAELSVQSEVNFLFALAKAYEDRGEFEHAWSYYQRGNRRQRQEVNYDPVQTETTNDRLIAVFSHEFLRSHSGFGHPDPAPIFVVGLPRSGSTLLEQILASHSEVEGTSELPYIARLTNWLSRNRAGGINYPESVRELAETDFAALGEEYLEYARLHRRSGAPRFIDKMPNNFPNVGLMALLLPNAKIIDARRHPVDACLSCYRQLFAKGQAFTYDLGEIGEYYLQYQRMMDHWAQVLPGRVLTVQYEQVVNDFESQVRRLLEFCGLDWQPECLRFYASDRAVRTPSSEQVRQPIYDRSVGHWRHYEQHLGELLAVLEPLRERYRAYEPAARGGT
jgi:tetratricopeptide (TPR) repeat protein